MKNVLNSENYQNTAKRIKPPSAFFTNKLKKSKEAGFSLVEVTIGLVIFMIAVLGVFGAFGYSINYNSGNSSRAQALALLQQKVERMRSLTFVPQGADAELKGGEKAPQVVPGMDGQKYSIQVTVDDDPFTPGIDIDDSTTFKEISVTVTLESPTPGWQTSVPATVILRRVRGN
ncbi:MAG TPA: prepilin-type N-terminal cleavage/methylation domain-containing protein [Pyrinomonadaceae bacterium]|jgi:type II secretory pathway pseudopilin PulG